jgi:biopolymer transport protein TolR
MGMAAGGAGGGGSRRGRRRGGSRHAVMSDINMTPFIDVMLVLLIIFMVSAPMMTVGVAIDLPKSQASQLQGQVKPVSVTIKADGKIFIQEAEVRLDDIAPRLTALVPSPADTSIQVRGDIAANYGSVNQVLGVLNKAGFKKLALISEQQ